MPAPEDDFGLALLTGKTVAQKQIGGIPVRHMTIATLEMLRQIDSPLLHGKKVEDPQALLGDVLNFVYLHAADEEDALEWVFLPENDRKKAVLRFFSKYTLKDSTTMLVEAIQMISDAVSTQVDAAPPDIGSGSPKKPQRKK